MFLCTSNEQPKIKFKKCFIYNSIKNEILMDKSEMHNTSILKAAKLRKIDLNKWSDIQSLWSGKVTMTNMSILHIQIQAIPFRS